MRPPLEELLARIRALQEEVEEVCREARDDLDRQREALAGEFLRRQRLLKRSLLRFVLGARPLVVLTAPVIYAGWIPFLLMDLFVSLYQAACFPVYGIPKVRRADYLVFGREDLPYLNLVEKFNCLYCSYANGVAAYTREVAARTEQYWCPIKHARRLAAAHGRYPNFFEYGDAETYRRELERLRGEFDDLREKSPGKRAGGG
ncbi:MAG: hypothetical protein AB7P08_14300 [Burkholderiales bacterium]